MSIEAINWAFNQDISGISDKLVLLALADFANDEFVAYPSYSTLVKKCSCTRQTIATALSNLAKRGFVEKVDSNEHIPNSRANG